jgi:2-polyprenyl-6-methoxyphenol hydroxylase-like FAD-dependent oxidoreductase
MNNSEEQEVLIVGAGPTGLFAAIQLARHGVMPRVVEQRLVPHRQARATAIQPAGLELLARAGVLAPFMDRSVHVRRTRFFGPHRTELGVSNFSGIGCRYEYQCSLPQWQTESILLAHFHRLGGAVERGTKVLSVDNDGDCLKATLKRTDGTVETMLARYVLGAGGAHDITRDSMHGSLDGDTYHGRYIAADIRVDMQHDPEESLIFVNSDGFALLAPLPEDRWITFVNIDEERESLGPEDTPEVAQVRELLNRRIGLNVDVQDMHWAAQFAMHKRITRRLADGHRFLMGDAAHLSSPIGGEGLNSALMDAADIAWKLALVVRGEARPTLLSSYAAERGLADHHVLEVSDLLHRRIMDLVAACAGGSAPPAKPPPDPARALELARARAMLDVTYTGSKLVGENVGPHTLALPAPAPGERFPDCIELADTSHHLITFGEVAALDRIAARWAGTVSIVDGNRAGLDGARAGMRDGGVLLVRPDGFIGFRAVPADIAGMNALDAHLTSYLIPLGSDHGMANGDR